MLRSFDWLAFRQLKDRRLRALLTAFGIVLGVGMVFAVLLLVATIRHSFDELIDSAWGNIDAMVSGEAGVIPAAEVDSIRDTSGVGSVTPWIGTMFTRLDARGRPIEGNTEDLLICAYDPTEADAFDFEYVQGRPVRAGREVVIEDDWAGDHGIAVGERIPVATGGDRASLRVVGTFTFEGGVSFAGPGLSAMPLASARDLMGIPTGFTSVNVTAADRSEAEQLRGDLRRELGSGFKVQSPDQLSQDFAGQLEALNVVLYFFSGVALFVGGFLILNSFNMTVLQRTREIGMLRTLGATRRMIMRTLLIEALVLGLLGGVLGLALGLALALGLIELMRGLEFPVADLSVSPGAAVTAAVTGLLATAVGASYPALRAGRMEPIRAVLGTAQVRLRPSPYRAVVGLALLLPGLILGGSFWFGGANSGTTLAAISGIGLTMAMFAGMAMLAPFVVMPLIRLLSVPFRLLIPVGGRLAADSVRANPSRTSATAAALMIGLAVVVTNAGMSGSFLNTIKSQLDAAYARDFTVAPIGTALEDAGEQTVPPSLRKRIAKLPGAGVVTPVRSVLIDFPGLAEAEPGLVLGIDPDAYGEVDETPIEGQSRDQALAGVRGGGVIVGKLYAQKADLGIGDRILLRGPGETREVPVAGVLDVIGEFGGMTMQISLPAMRTIYGVTADAQLAVSAASTGARTALESDIDRLIRRDYPNLEVLSSGEVKQNVEDDVNQQFAMFNAILVIAVIVSLLGVINTLAMSVMERTREIGLLRALGSSRWQVRRTMLDESLLITIAGGLVGIGFGAVTAWAWVRSLDGTLPGIAFSFPLDTSVTVAVAAVLLGVVAAILPARRASRLKVINALSYE